MSKILCCQTLSFIISSGVCQIPASRSGSFCFSSQDFLYWCIPNTTHSFRDGLSNPLISTNFPNTYITHNVSEGKQSFFGFVQELCIFNYPDSPVILIISFGFPMTFILPILNQRNLVLNKIFTRIFGSYI